jgi:hypothetical protein
MQFSLIGAVLLCGSVVHADDDTVDAALGGGIGGATGAAIGEKLGDRDGAIIGGAIGGAVGAAIATDDERAERRSDPIVLRPVVAPSHPARHCPPGQAKKGRC